MLKWFSKNMKIILKLVISSQHWLQPSLNRALLTQVSRRITQVSDIDLSPTCLTASSVTDRCKVISTNWIANILGAEDYKQHSPTWVDDAVVAIVTSACFTSAGVTSAGVTSQQLSFSFLWWCSEANLKTNLANLVLLAAQDTCDEIQGPHDSTWHITLWPATACVIPIPDFAYLFLLHFSIFSFLSFSFFLWFFFYFHFLWDWLRFFVRTFFGAKKELFYAKKNGAKKEKVFAQKNAKVIRRPIHI